jgi:hypothetical protein
MLRELVGQRQNETDESLLILRIDIENIGADALCNGWLVEQTVVLDAFECAQYAVS